jgi:integrase
MKGSVQKRTGKNDVSWCAVYDEPRPDGRRQQRRKTFRTRREAETFLAKTVTAIDTGSYVAPSNETVGEYLTRWLEETAATVKPSTIHTYAGVVARHLVPDLGAIPLAKLSARDVQALYGRLLGRGLSPSSVRLAHAVLHRALDRAVALRLVVTNAADAAKQPRSMRPKVRTLSPDEARAFLRAALADDLAALWLLALHTQMRQGEMIALRWQDVDLARGTLTVRQTRTRDAMGKQTYGDPKSMHGRRTITLGAETVASLRAHHDRQAFRRNADGDAWHDEDAVFDRGDGRPVAARTLHTRFKRVLVDAGVPGIRFHDLRHTGATLMIANGVPAKVVSERLGHANISITLGLYAHVQEGMQRDAADGLEAMLRPARDQIVTTQDGGDEKTA